MTASRNRRARHATLCAVAALSLGLVACGGEPGESPTVTQTQEAPATEAPTEASPSPTPTTQTPTADPTEVSTMPGGNGMALPLMLNETFLPVGWNTTEPRDSGGFRMTICGVDIEPNEPIDGATKTWQRAPTGPWLEQHVRVYDDNTARDVLAALKAAVPDCKRYTATDEKGGSSTFEVSPLTLRSATNNVVSWRQRLVPADTAAPSSSATGSSTPTPTGSATASPRPSTTASPGGTGTATGTAAPTQSEQPERPTLTQDVAVARIGSSTVMLVSYAVDQTPSVALLDSALSAALVLP